jgi:indolepyruvate ferredoxin oxidoreductase
VARLYATGEFMRKIDGMFEGDYRVNFHLAPPLLARPDPLTGEPRKMKFGPWMMRAFGGLARLKGLRGTAFDIFGRTAERRMERALIGEYEQTVDRLLQDLTHDNHALAVEIASLPEAIRGFGHIKAKSVSAARAKQAELMGRYGAAPVRAAA